MWNRIELLLPFCYFHLFQLYATHSFFKQLLGLADFCATEYFSRTARIWEKTGMYSSLRPNRNPNSDYGKWIREERRSNGITVQ